MEVITRSAFGSRIDARSRRERLPTICLFELTPTCNLRCHFCYVALDPYKGPYLSTDEVYSILDKLEQAGVLWLALTGGEAMTRRDFAAIYRRAVSKGFLVSVFTNATMVTQEVAALFGELPPSRVEVSIYGADATHYEGVTGIPGSFARFERGVALLQDAGVNLLMKHPVSSLTEDHVGAIHEWCESRKLPHQFSTTIENRHDGGAQPSLYRIAPRRVDKLNVELHRTRTGRDDALPLPECSMGGADDGIERLYRCGAGRSALFVDANGRASHCVMDRDPSFPLLEMEWQDVWSAIGAWVDQPLPKEAPCSGCGLRSGCNNCPARAKMSTGSPYLKDTYHCDVTHERYGFRRYSIPIIACPRGHSAPARADSDAHPGTPSFNFNGGRTRCAKLIRKTVGKSHTRLQG